MDRIRKIIVGLLLGVVLAVPAPFAFGSSHGPRSHRSVGRAKTVHVRSYVTKKGKHVKAYNRAAPNR